MTQPPRLKALETALYGALLRQARPGMAILPDGRLHAADIAAARRALKEIEALVGAPLPVVTCSACAMSFPEAVPGGQETGQGVDCAVRVGRDARLVRGCYGSSRHDMSTYAADEKAGLKPGQVICDACVDAMLADGRLRVAEGA